MSCESGIVIVESCVGGFMAYQVHEYVGDLEYGGHLLKIADFAEAVFAFGTGVNLKRCAV